MTTTPEHDPTAPRNDLSATPGATQGGIQPTTPVAGAAPGQDQPAASAPAAPGASASGAPQQSAPFGQQQEQVSHAGQAMPPSQAVPPTGHAPSLGQPMQAAEPQAQPGMSERTGQPLPPTARQGQQPTWYQPGQGSSSSFGQLHQAGQAQHEGHTAQLPAQGVTEPQHFGSQPQEHQGIPDAQPNVGAVRAKGRTGMLLAGLAIGALLGGVVGGGVSAIVAHNVAPQQSTQASPSGTITLNNAEDVTQISGVAAVATPSVVTIEVSSSTAAGSGSGVIYDKDGYIVTNAHVVTLDGAASDAKVRVKLSDGRVLDGTVVGTAPYSDLAVVKVDAGDPLPAVTLADSDKLNVGDLTVAIGAPLNLANTVTSGVVSSLHRGISVGSPLVPQDPGSQDDGSSGESPWDFRFGLPDQGQQQQQQQSSGGTVTLSVIQTDASINPGNSGGALLNGSGELIGINVAIASPTSSSGTAGSNGLGFAIPSNTVKRIADEIISGEKPSYGLLGATVDDSVNDTDADANHVGGLLVQLTSGGAAEQAGLKSGDVITAVDGVPVTDGTSLSATIRTHAAGSKVTIDYTRNGKAGQTEATLGKLDW